MRTPRRRELSCAPKREKEEEAVEADGVDFAFDLWSERGEEEMGGTREARRAMALRAMAKLV